ncbi:hypothetical protein F4824DRAFT_508812 [Ustulina deusta]|nr:hypothetical protein F4824DRAFT_508812 [Ustulina deusta]
MNTSSASSSPCPHSYEEGVPVCWDCTEEGHVNTPHVAEEERVSPGWQKFRRFRKSLGFWDASLRRSYIYPTRRQSSTLELQLPEEGLEVAAPNSRRSQPGLIVVAGPRVVSPEDKFQKPEQKSWNSETIQRDSDATIGVAVAGVAVAGAAAAELDTKVWGLQKKKFQILVVIAIIAFVGVIIGIAVGVTQQKSSHSTSLSTSISGQVSSSSLSTPPVIVTETLSLHVEGHSTTAFVTLPKTTTSSSSSQVSTTTTATTTATGGRVGVDPEPASIITVFVTQLPPSPTDTIRSQPATTVRSAPPPENTSPLSPSSPSPTFSPSSRVCIGKDESTYTDPSTGARFRIECGVAHQGKDIENLEAYTMQSCISMCANNRHCKGAIWFNVGPQGTDLNYCWLKSEMDDNNIQLTADAQSVVRL